VPAPCQLVGYLNKGPVPSGRPALVAEIDTDVAADGPYDRPRHPITVLRIRHGLKSSPGAAVNEISNRAQRKIMRTDLP
jgi:hypothetical protein